MSGVKRHKARPPMPPGREATRKARPTTLDLAPPGAGRSIVNVSWAGTIALAVSSVLGVIQPDTLGIGALVVALAMFFLGTAIFVWSYFVAIGRSREDEVALAGVYGLAGSTPTIVRRRLFGSLVAEVLIAIGGTVARPRTTLAFDFLAVMWGLGLAGLWGAYHGAFPPRAVAAASTGSRSGRRRRAGR